MPVETGAGSMDGHEVWRERHVAVLPGLKPASESDGARRI